MWFLYVFSMRLAAGLAAALIALPIAEVSSRFHRIQMLVGLGLLLAGWLACPEKNVTASVAISCGMVASYAGTCLWQAGMQRPARVVCLLVTMSALAALVFARGQSAQGNMCCLLADDALSGGLVGTVLTAMLIGHWYLIAPSMSQAPLVRMIHGALGLLVARTTWLVPVVAAWMGTGASEANGHLLAVWWILRVGVGLVGLGVLLVMARVCARMRATQSATGILYVGVVFACIGELADLVLSPI
ncbi:MAG: hypothetical protein C4297_08295 [Gemmataceae bacterium]